MEYNSYLKDNNLNLDGNNTKQSIGDNYDNLISLELFIKDNPTITNLDLSNNNISSQGNSIKAKAAFAAVDSLAVKVQALITMEAEFVKLTIGSEEEKKSREKLLCKEWEYPLQVERYKNYLQKQKQKQKIKKQTQLL